MFLTKEKLSLNYFPLLSLLSLPEAISFFYLYSLQFNLFMLKIIKRLLKIVDSYVILGIFNIKKIRRPPKNICFKIKMNNRGGSFSR